MPSASSFIRFKELFVGILPYIICYHVGVVMNEAFILWKGVTDLTMTSSGRVPMVITCRSYVRVNRHWTYKDYATLPDDRHRYKCGWSVVYGTVTE
jgi:hypothetical protein